MAYLESEGVSSQAACAVYVRAWSVGGIACSTSFRTLDTTRGQSIIIKLIVTAGGGSNWLALIVLIKCEICLARCANRVVGIHVEVAGGTGWWTIQTLWNIVRTSNLVLGGTAGDLSDDGLVAIDRGTLLDGSVSALAACAHDRFGRGLISTVVATWNRIGAIIAGFDGKLQSSVVTKSVVFSSHIALS